MGDPSLLQDRMHEPLAEEKVKKRDFLLLILRSCSNSNPRSPGGPQWWGPTLVYLAGTAQLPVKGERRLCPKDHYVFVGDSKKQSAKCQKQRTKNGA